MECPRCKKDLPDGTRFCSDCGTELQYTSKGEDDVIESVSEVPVIEEGNLGFGAPPEEPAESTVEETPKKKINVKLIAIIAAAAAVIIGLVITLVLLLPPAAPDNPDDGDGGTSVDGKTTYTLSIKTTGGMPLSGVVVTVYSDNTFDDLEGYTTTDANGVATLKLAPSNNYAIKLSGAPEGYNIADYYSFSGTSAVIKLASSVIPNTSLNGVVYKLGSIMRDFTITNTEGDDVTLSELLKTKDAVLLNFWYTTCSWCIEEFPDMQAAYEEYSDKIAIVAVDPLLTDTMMDIQLFQQDMGLTFNMGQDKNGLATSFGVTGYPTSVMIDRYGTVCLIVPGAITGQKYFNAIFEHFIGDDYEQKLLTKYEDLAPAQKPDVEMPSSEDINAAVSGGALDATFYPEEGTADAEYAWPFIVGEKDGVDCIKTTNAYLDSSYAIMNMDIELSVGDALGFDYFSSTEAGSDILYVLVNGVSINQISGRGEGWETCYPYVAVENGKHKVTFLYLKDGDTDVGEDTMYIKNIRKTTASAIDTPSYIPRWAATVPSESGVGYDNYVEIFYNEADGYYHVGSVDGPLLLANLMGKTPFSDEASVYSLLTFAVENGEINAMTALANEITTYCNYASNSQINGLCTVTEELRTYLEAVAECEGFEEDNPNVWLQFCLYYDAYGTDGEQLEDPIKGLAHFSAYDVILNESAGLDVYPNSFVYDRVLMPRGLWARFTPTTSGVYRIVSNVDKNDNTLSLAGWIFLKDGSFYFENCIMERFVDDANNVNMYVYLEAGTDYYIDIAFDDIYKFETVNYKVEYLGESYEHFRAVSPGAPFTYELDENGEVTNILIAGGVKVVYDADEDCYYNVLPDGTKGSSKIYVDFTMWNSIFGEKALYRIIQDGAFNFAMTENDHLAKIYLSQYTDAELRQLWGEEYDANCELYQIDDVRNGIYHGTGTDYTAVAEKYYGMIFDGTTTDDENLMGCTVVTAELAEALQALMDKYTFKDVENSWVKLCYFYETIDENWEWIPNT